MEHIDLVQLMYNEETNHLHNSDLSDLEDFGYRTLGILERDLAFEFGKQIGMQRRTRREILELYTKFLENNR